MWIRCGFFFLFRMLKIFIPKYYHRRRRSCKTDSVKAHLAKQKRFLYDRIFSGFSVRVRSLFDFRPVLGQKKCRIFCDHVSEFSDFLNWPIWNLLGTSGITDSRLVSCPKTRLLKLKSDLNSNALHNNTSKKKSSFSVFSCRNKSITIQDKLSSRQ